MTCKMQFVPADHKQSQQLSPEKYCQGLANIIANMTASLRSLINML